MDTATLSTVRDVMSEKVLYINTDHTFTQISRMFVELKIHHLPVINQDGTLAGMVSANDILKAYTTLLPGLPDTKDATINQRITIYDLMTPAPLLTLHADAPIHEAAQLMGQKRVHALPILDEQDQVMGIISGHDIVRYCAQEL